MVDRLRQIVLARHCEGLPRPDDFRLEEGELPQPSAGQFRVRHVWSSADPGTRSRLSPGVSYAKPVAPGRPIDGFSVGVIEASEHEAWPEGALVFCAGGWRSHSLQNGKGFIGRIPETGLPLSLWIGVLGVPGLTAWFGLKRVGAFKPGDRVLVTSAAGPVGATAGQLARLWGASQVIGIAGSEEKCNWLTRAAGFDRAINYKTEPDLTGAITQAMPEGIDILFDNVGNAMIERALGLMRFGGRIVVSGQVADYNLALEEVPPIRNTRPFITSRVRMEGLVVFDDAAEFPEALSAMAGHISDTSLVYKEERFEGLEAFPEAFCGLFRGENFGRRVVRVGPDP